MAMVSASVRVRVRIVPVTVPVIVIVIVSATLTLTLTPGPVDIDMPAYVPTLANRHSAAIRNISRLPSAISIFNLTIRNQPKASHSGSIVRPIGHAKGMSGA